MASPGLSEIVTTTLRERARMVADNIHRNNALYARLKSKGKRRTVSGGRTIVQPLEYAQNSTYKRYSGYEVLNIAPSDVLTAAEFPWRQSAVAVSMSGLEMLQNSGKAQIIDLLESRISNAEKTFIDGLSYDIYSDGSLAGQIGGLQFLVSATPTTGTVGGIDRATYPFWRNQVYSSLTDGGAALSAANCYQQMNSLWVRLNRGGDRPDLIVASNTAWQAYSESMHALQRITNENSDVAKAGFSSLKFYDSDVVLDGGFQGYSSDPIPVGGVPTGVNFYFLNTDYIYFTSHADRNVVPLDPDRFSVNQDAMVKLIGWAGNMTLSGAFLQGVLTT